jgi:hypothetical protein
MNSEAAEAILLFSIGSSEISPLRFTPTVLMQVALDSP